MKLKKDWYNAIDERCSRRTYMDKVLIDNHRKSIAGLILECNNESGLNIQLVSNDYNIINGFKQSYGLITGAKAYIAFVAEDTSENKVKVGYYGEMIVLECTKLGLGTCWIGGTYDKVECRKHIEIGSNEELICIVAVGYVKEKKSIKEKLVASINKKSKDIDDMLLEGDKEAPEWVRVGIEAVSKAPSALNKKPVAYRYKGNKVIAEISKRNYGYEDIDLGISMLHFQLGAMSMKVDGAWDYKDNQYLFS